VAPVSAQLYGGNLQATAHVNAHKNRYELNQQLSHIQLGPLLRDVAKNDMLEGRAAVSTNVSTTGTTVSALKKALNGTASVRLNDGAIKGYDLGKTLANAREKMNALVKGGATSNDQGGGSAQEKTQFSELSASFNIVNGVAKNDDLNVKAPLFRLGGNGHIDLGASRVDYLARASVVNTLTGQGGKDKTQTRDLTIPVRIVGPFDKLAWEVQWSAVGSEALKASLGGKLEEKKQQLQDKARDQVKDKLKGLLGR
jgi:AsmA protein